MQQRRRDKPFSPSVTSRNEALPSSSSSAASPLNLLLLLLLTLTSLYLYTTIHSPPPTPPPPLSESSAAIAALSMVAHANALLRGTPHEDASKRVEDMASLANDLANEAEDKLKGLKSDIQQGAPPAVAAPAAIPATSPAANPALALVPHPHLSGERKHLAIGMASGINPAQLVVFVASLREHSPSTASTIVLFMDSPSLTKQTVEILNKYEATVVEFDPKTIEPAVMRDFHPSTYRWPMIAEYVDKHKESFNNVILCDVRDMAFQGDPFAVVPPESPGLYVFNGVEHIIIGDDGWNGPWIKDCFGEGVFQNLFKEKIICSGVSIGAIDDMVLYLNLMSSTMLEPDFALCERNGVDQGVHNVLIQTGRLKTAGVSVFRHDQSSGEVANMQAGIMSVTANFLVRNKNNAVVPVVHQYDRYEKLMNDMFRRYVYWDMNTEKAGEGACGGYTIKENVEAFKGRCDLDHVGDEGEGVEGCCTRCKNKAGCKGFTHLRKGCWLKSCNDVDETMLLAVPGATGGWMI